MKKEPDLKNPEIAFAVEAVVQAAQAAKMIQKEQADLKLLKSDDSPVTAGDFAGQALVSRLLAQHFPKDSLVGEERAEKLKSTASTLILKTITQAVRQFDSKATPEKICEWIDQGRGEAAGRFWTVDPIDGTKGYLRGDQYAVALALIVNGKVQMGILACPHLDENGTIQPQGPGALFIAVRGQGAWASGLNDRRNFIPLKVSSCKDATCMRILCSVEPSHTSQTHTEAFIKDLGLKSGALAMDSQAKYARLAAAGGEAFFYLVPKSKPNHRMKIWDVAPGSIIVEEAGGRVSDLEGKTLDYSAGTSLKNNPGILVTNGHLHELVLTTLKKLNRNSKS